MHADSSRAWLKFNWLFVTCTSPWSVLRPSPFDSLLVSFWNLHLAAISRPSAPEPSQNETGKRPDNKRPLPGAVVECEGLESEVCILLLVGNILVLLCQCCRSAATPKSRVRGQDWMFDIRWRKPNENSMREFSITTSWMMNTLFSRQTMIDTMNLWTSTLSMNS